MGAQVAETLLDEIRHMEIIDTHEHLVNQEMLMNLGFNLFQDIELHYLKDDLMAVGMDENLIMEKASEPDSLIDELRPFLKQTQNTTYYRAFFRTLRDLHGLEEDDLDPAHLKRASDSISTAYGRPDWYDHVIRDRCKVRYMLRDMVYMPTENDFVKPVIRMDNYLIERHKNLLKHWLDSERILTLRIGDAEYGERVHSLDDYVALMEEDFQKALEFGAVAIKIAIAYLRTLQFDNVSADEANRAFKIPDDKTTWKDIKTFQDYIMFRIIENAAKHGLPVQVHTGLQARGKNTLSNSNPLHLSNIFLEFPDVRFDVFHGGFPFMGEIGSLALMFPNVYLDTCWLPLISYASFKRALSEWLCYVPAGKFLWGGDCASAEGVYGAVQLVQHGLAEVLAEKVDDGAFDEEYALFIAKSLLHDNATKLFSL